MRGGERRGEERQTYSFGADAFELEASELGLDVGNGEAAEVLQAEAAGGAVESGENGLDAGGLGAGQAAASDGILHARGVGAKDVVPGGEGGLETLEGLARIAIRRVLRQKRRHQPVQHRLLLLLLLGLLLPLPLPPLPPAPKASKLLREAVQRQEAVSHRAALLRCRRCQLRVRIRSAFALFPSPFPFSGHFHFLIFNSQCQRQGSQYQTLSYITKTSNTPFFLKFNY